MLLERMKEARIDPDTMKAYIDGFRFGCLPVSHQDPPTRPMIIPR